MFASLSDVNMATTTLKTVSHLKHFKHYDITASRVLQKTHILRAGRLYGTSEARKPITTTHYCLDIVKQNDYENFLSVLLLPQNARATAVAIRAFNVELAQVSDMTSETLMGKMRLQFWRDTLDQIYQGTAPKQPVALELQRAVEMHRLSKRWLRSLIDSREEQLDNKQFASIASVENYSEKCNSPLYYLILQGLGIENVHADHAASHLGKAEGIMRLVRGVPHHGAKRKVLLPRDLMMKHGISQEDVIRGSQEQKVKDVIFDTASIAHQHLEHARSFINDVPKKARICLLPSVAVATYLKALQRVQFDVFDSTLQRRNNKLPYLMLWAKFCNNY
ncbi:NADH dehydrogenase (ubiquinone) complex I, assembly factor 6-like isoform X6 [Homarus americanus]|uniref:NADH dehydrogenase (ubiquinone) complex I, assembly factor 6-like isoform X6 n=1 Tax=Homarus americanus TaxID=6706 RepID=UPI001C438C94|nr:NADH dehydrogenase (ubiquinone) complex I, assembly factor 6-like isoform X6 [Homarus americanus]